VTGQLEFMRFLLPESESLERFYIDYFRAHMERLGLELRPGEKDNDRILRGSVAAGLALVDRNFAQKLAGRFQEYEKVKPDLRSAVAIAYAQSRGAEAFDDSVKMMKRMGNEADIVKIYGALTSIREAGAVERTLDLCISGEFNRADSLYAVRGATRNPYVREATWNWVTGHLETFREMFRGTPYVSSIVQSLISGSGIGREKEVSDYFSRVKVEEAEKGIRKGLELLGVYSDLRRRMISESVN